MAVSIRLANFSYPKSLTVPSCLLVILALASSASCLPALPAPGMGDLPVVHHWRRMNPIVVTSEDGTNTTVLNPATNQVIEQGAATDGGGVDFSLPAIIWLAFAFAVGTPLALAGIRLWRATTGAGVGLTAAVLIWAAFINTVSAEGLSDILLTIITLSAFGIGFLIGALNVGRMAGILLLGVLGGLSIGIRIVLLRPGLLIPVYVANWFLLAVFMIIGLGAMLYRQRFGLVTFCAAVGTFLVTLGIDLVLNKQSGMSRGLRFLFDRNSSHYLDIVDQNYHPPIITQVLLGVSLGAIPILAYAQHKVFRAPFRPETTELDSASVAEEIVALNQEKEADSPAIPAKTLKGRLLGSRFSTS